MAGPFLLSAFVIVKPVTIPFETLAHRASQRYAQVSITAMEFARNKMLMDPMYEVAMRDGMLPSHGTLLDIGCGQGLMLTLLDEASRFEKLIGVELRPRMAFLARAALGARAEILEADVRTVTFEPCSAVILFDVLQAMPRSDQESLLDVVVKALGPKGVVLLRDADASGGWRFRLVSISNRLKGYLMRTWGSGRHYRTRNEWLAVLEGLGLDARVCETPSKNPLGNVLIRAEKR